MVCKKSPFESDLKASVQLGNSQFLYFFLCHFWRRISQEKEQEQQLKRKRKMIQSVSFCLYQQNFYDVVHAFTHRFKHFSEELTTAKRFI